ncbi:CarD family transcriptional regulator [Nocardioides jishulii]|uniref:CarD-like/TRCF RNAP-interacting domain-containing protein n=1 Tax=Nocardioides jishulii TaxID=2575440 RepID=A0A4U2YTQ0_9ACTN|nr:CarD family transcriptional regulator [Nocardioides jishulii]QCX28537.1 hypothetical protein FCL41_14105 [Nocardioides jishulii]TKI64570.1 hypothetical protein FC770_05470 [Nocardioides jishulii]
MEFSQGQTVIHPHHGPATVAKVFSRTFKGKERQYLELKVHSSDLSINLPIDQADEVGVRAVFAQDETNDLLDVLRAPTGAQEQNWSRRMKANSERLKLGDLPTTASVVRDLIRRQEEHGLSPNEREMLKASSRLVLAELALSLSIEESAAEELLRATVLGEETALGDEVAAQPADA